MSNLEATITTGEVIPVPSKYRDLGESYHFRYRVIDEYGNDYVNTGGQGKFDSADNSIPPAETVRRYEFVAMYRSKGSQGPFGTDRYDFNLGELATVITSAVDNLSIIHYGLIYTPERAQWSAKISGEFWRVFANLASFTQPTMWCVDTLQTDGAFGILLSGQYTGLVLLRADGSVSSHT